MNFILDFQAPQYITDKLTEYGVVYKSTNSIISDKSVSTHPDMQIHFVSEDTAYCPKSTLDYYRKTLPAYINLHMGKSKIGEKYPLNCAYNIARVGRYVLCNTNYAEERILEYYKKHGYKIIHINQGYAKCNICPISDNLFITEDEGISKTLHNIKDITVLYIPCGGVSLNGFAYGFIGGATGADKNNIYISGKHKALDDIKSLTERYGKKLVILSDKPAIDIGTIITFD